MPDDPDRRKFLKLATCGIGAGLGLAAGVPAVSLIVSPAGRRTVTTPKEPIDLGDPGQLGPSWRRIDVVAPMVRDAWIAARDVVLGAAYVRRRDDKIEALSGVCPHLGCTVGWQDDKKTFLCACHDSVFSEEGERGKGPSKRGLDPLPVELRDGRLQLTWVRYKLDTASREPV
jgi:menaquinol-cytochrome c reductase iron-sulfur subunit